MRIAFFMASCADLDIGPFIRLKIPNIVCGFIGEIDKILRQAFGHATVGIFNAHNAIVSDLPKCIHRIVPINIAGHGHLMGIYSRIIVKMGALN